MPIYVGLPDVQQKDMSSFLAPVLRLAGIARGENVRHFDPIINCTFLFAEQKNDNFLTGSYFQSCPSVTFYLELLKIVIFCIPEHNASNKRAFSLINAKWRKERKSTVDAIRGILLTKNNFKKLSCMKFHEYIARNDELLHRVASSEKYDRV